MRTRSNNTHYLFWIILILFSNPGGIQQALGIFDISMGFKLNDFLILSLIGLSISLSYDNRNNSKDYMKIKTYLILFLLYYFIVFGFLTPLINGTNPNSVIFNIIKLRWGFYTVILFFLVYRFFIVSYALFFRLLAISSISILTIFFFSILTGIEILPYIQISRGFVEIDRNLLLSYGFMPFLIPIGTVLIVFKFNIKYRKILIIGAVFMFIAWLISLTRRHIFGTFIVFFISTVYHNFVHKNKFISIAPIFRLLTASSLVLLLLFITFPKYIGAGIRTIEETISVIQFGVSIEGKKDSRLGFDKEFIVALFVENPIIGTGFDERWNTSEGDKQGFEASDYPLLSAFAMTGILGVLIFLPVYIILIKALIFDVRFLRKHRFNHRSFETFMLILFIVIFSYSLLQYMNWFAILSNTKKQYNFTITLAMYFASRHIYYSTFKIKC